MPEVDPDWPVLEDPSRFTYIRPEGDGLMVGLFETVCAPWNVGPDPRGLLVRFDHAGLGPDGSLRRGGDGAGACHARRRDPHVLLRARVVHAGPAARDRRGPGGAQLLRRRGAELDRHPDRRRLGPGDRALDHHGIAGHRRHGREHRPPAPVPGHAALPRHADGREPGDGLRVPLPGALDAHGPGRAALAAARADGRSGRLVQGRLRLGGHGLVRRRGSRPQPSPRPPGAGPTSGSTGRPSTAPCARASGCSTCRSWRSSR